MSPSLSVPHNQVVWAPCWLLPKTVEGRKPAESPSSSSELPSRGKLSYSPLKMPQDRFLFWGGCSKLSQTGELKTTEVYSQTVLEAWRLKSRAVLPPKDSFLSLRASGGCQPLWLVAASLQPLPLSSHGLPMSRPSPLVFSSQNTCTGLGAHADLG